jgi:hypothetical protein
MRHVVQMPLAMVLNTMLTALAASQLLAEENEAVNEIPEEVAAELESRLRAEEVIVVETLRGPSGRGHDNRQLEVLSRFVTSMETKHARRWLTLCFLPIGLEAVDSVADSEMRRPCAKFPVWLGEEWAPSRTTRTLLQETVERLRTTEVHLLNLVGSFCGQSVILELLRARVIPRTVVFASGRGFAHCAQEIFASTEAVVGFRAHDMETFLRSLGYYLDPLTELLEEAGVPLTILTVGEPSEFLQASGKFRLRDDIPCQSLSARDELRESAELNFSIPCVGLEGGKLVSRVRLHADEDTSVAVDRLLATRPRICRQGASSNDDQERKQQMINILNTHFWDRQRNLDRLRTHSQHFCKW